MVVLAHAMYDTTSVGVAPFASTGVPLVAFALSAAVTWVVAIGLLVALGQAKTVARRRSATPGPAGDKGRGLAGRSPQTEDLAGH